MPKRTYSEQDAAYGLFLVQEAVERQESIDSFTREMIAEREARKFQGEIASLAWLAERIGMKPEQVIMTGLAFKRGQIAYRSSFKEKRGRGMRRIDAPSGGMRKLLRKIAKGSFFDFVKSPHSFGFLGGSTYDALLPHAKNTSLLMVDVVNAFPTITRNDIFEWLRRHGYSWRISTFIADLTTHEGKLAQGSPLSPLIFELMFEWIDKRLSVLARNVDGVYTRYADNIFFSIPKDIMDRNLVWTILKKIWRIDLFDLAWHERRYPSFDTHKLRIRTIRGETIRTLGLVIRDGSVCNTRDFKRKLRKRIHHLSWLLDHGAETEDILEAWSKLCGHFSYAQQETLPVKLLREVEELRSRIYELQ